MVQVKRISWSSATTQYREAPGFEELINQLFQQEHLGKDDIVKIELEHSDEYDYLAIMIFYDNER